MRICGDERRVAVQVARETHRSDCHPTDFSRLIVEFSPDAFARFRVWTTALPPPAQKWRT